MRIPTTNQYGSTVQASKITGFGLRPAACPDGPRKNGNIVLWAALLFLLGLPLPTDAEEPTLARLSFWVPPERMEEFETAYEKEVAPFLKAHGHVESSRRSRATVDSVFSRLFEYESPARRVAKGEVLRADSTARENWRTLLRGLGATFGTPFWTSGLIRSEFVSYSAPAGTGKTMRAGAGETVRAGAGNTVLAGAGFRQGLWQSLSDEDGLPSSLVLAILQDRQGDLWFGTAGGVSRYDGAQFTTFTTENGLAHNRVSSIVEDRQGNLWFGTWGGVSRYDGQHFTTFTTADGLAHNHVNDMAEDRQGNLWFGTGSLANEGAGVSRFDGSHFTTFTTADGLAHNHVNDMVEDQKGNLWFGTAGGGVSRYDEQEFVTFTAADGLGGNSVYSIMEDRQGHLWFGTRGGVSRYDGQHFMTFTIQGLPLYWAYSIVEDQQGNLWFGTFQEGLIRYDGQHFTTFTTQDGLPSNNVSAMVEDRQGTLWVGTSGGLSRYDGETFTTFTTQDGLGDNGVYPMLEDRAGHLWLGTLQGGVSRYDGQHFTTFTTQDGLAHDRVRSIMEDRQGHLWFGTWGGVSRYDGQEFVTFTTQDGLAHNTVRSMVEDRQGTLWFGTHDGVSRYDGETFTTLAGEDGPGTNIVWTILEDSRGHLWFGTVEVGAIRYDGQKFTRFTAQDGLGGNDVRSIVEDRQGHLWFGGFRGGGVHRYDGKEFVTFTTQDGLAKNTVLAMMEDRQGHLWFGTHGGVSRYDGKVFQTVSRRDGLVNNQVQGILQDRHGDVWFATGGDLTRYRPQQTFPPTIHLTDVIADRHYESIQELSLPSTQTVVTFEFQGSSLTTRPGGMVYVYRLQGYDDEWRPTYEGQVGYTDLPTGDYVFQVKVVDRDLNYSEPPAQVRLKIHPPYKTMAWIGLVGLAVVVALVSSGAAWRHRRAQRQAERALLEEQRRRLEERQQAQDLLIRSESMAAIGTLVAGAAHELNNPLGAATSLVQSVQEMIEEDTAAQLKEDRSALVDHLAFSRKELQRAQEIVGSLLGLSRQTQEYTETVDLHTVVADALRVLYNRYKRYDVNIAEDYQEDLPAIRGNFAQLGQVCLNLIQNAIEALGGLEGQITLRTYATAEEVVFECGDTGPGMSASVLQDVFKPFFTTKAPGEGTGLGLYISHEIVEKHGGQIRVDSVEGKGTTFWVELPLQNVADSPLPDRVSTAKGDSPIT